MFHMSLFETRVAHVSGDVLVFYIDFETTGLNVLAAEVLEIGVTEARSLSHVCARAPAMPSARVPGAVVRTVRHNGVAGASVYISSYKELNPSKSPFSLDARPRNAGLV